MRIFTEQALKEYAENHPDSKVALQEWTTIVKRSKVDLLSGLRSKNGFNAWQTKGFYFPTFKLSRYHLRFGEVNFINFVLYILYWYS